MNNDTTQDRQDDATRADVRAAEKKAEPRSRIDFYIRRAERAQAEALEKYVIACGSMARYLQESAKNATRVTGSFVSDTVMSNSLVQDIPKYATSYREIGDQLQALRDVRDNSAEIKPARRQS